VLHPWLQRELSAILAQCPPAPDHATPGRRWVDWRYQPGAEGLDRHLPPLRLLLIWDNLSGHCSPGLVQWCAAHGIGVLYTPLSGSWLHMAESVQRISSRRALAGRHATDTATLMTWLRDALIGWNRHPTAFTWGGKRHARRDRAYARRHRLGGSGATTTTAVVRRRRSVRQYHVPPFMAN
jgi:hypothetical protein